MTTALVYSDRYLRHDFGRGHPERPERLKAIVEGLKKAGYWSPGVKVVEPTPAKREDVEFAHDREYVSLVERLSKRGEPLDADTPTRRNSFELALLAAGGAIKAGGLVLSGEATNSFALVRPAGHHASRARGGGFCFFNNLAVAIKYLQQTLGLKRALILDFDAHHGNGTQDIFYEDPSVLFMSIHQDPSTLYPGTGFVYELGAGKGEGYTVNVPMPPGSGDAEYATVMREIFVPLSERFKPELFAVSAGFDAHVNDPLTQLGLSTSAYGWLVSCIVEQAEKLCGGRVMLVLEGGYGLDALAQGVTNVVKVLGGERSPLPPGGRLDVVDELRRALAGYWSL